MSQFHYFSFPSAAAILAVRPRLPTEDEESQSTIARFRVNANPPTSKPAQTRHHHRLYWSLPGLLPKLIKSTKMEELSLKVMQLTLAIGTRSDRQKSRFGEQLPMPEPHSQFPPLTIMNSKHKTAATLLVVSPLLLSSPCSALSYPADDIAGPVIIEAPKTDAVPASRSDTATLLQDNPAFSSYGAAGMSSLPALHGMADDRIRIQLDGMDLTSSCPNHMNPPLSLMAPVQVGRIGVLAGITPVSAGGDSIAGTIQVDSPSPEFAAIGEPYFIQGQTGAFYRSNGDARGAHLSATYASDWLNLTYSGSSAESNNVHVATDFKAAGPDRLAGNVIGSSAYKSDNNQLALAMRHDKQWLELTASEQSVPYELFPTQRMDLEHNQSRQFNLHYQGKFEWGELNTRLYQQLSTHAMNFGPDKQLQYGTAQGMPMNTEAKTRGITARADIPLTDTYSATIGAELVDYQLNDWWPPATASVSGMGPDTFQNIHNGQRNRDAVYGELNADWHNTWSAQFGLRGAVVKMNADKVTGYNSMPMYAGDAAQFNAQDHERTDHHLDLTAALTHTMSDSSAIEAGYAQKTRSPNLYERYSWSAAGMTAAMNNAVGDGNGYVGNPDLKPEVAQTFSVSLSSQDSEDKQWQFKLTPYVTYVSNFIDAVRCPTNFSTNCSTANLTASSQFVILQYANQNALLYGIDGSGSVHLARIDQVGDFTLSGLLGFTRGKNRVTDDNLYNIMPLHSRLSLNHTLGKWSTTLEWVTVSAKDKVSMVRNENTSGGYGLINVKSRYKWTQFGKQFRIDVGIDNLLNREYAAPLGGAYLGQGKTMGLNSVEWGVPVPGLGRSLTTAVSVDF